MHCERCAASMDPSHCFPGAKLTCACGAVNIVRVDPDPPPAVDLHTRAAVAPAALAAPVVPIAPAPAAAAHVVARGAPTAAAAASCPRCGAALRPQAAHGEDVLACAACRGMFVGHPALARAVETAHADTARREDTSPPPRFERDVHYVKCPRCAEVMSRVNFGHRSGVLVDSCRIHGTWFDAGELDSVLAFVARGGLEEHASPGATPREAGAKDGDVVARATLQMQSALAVERMQDAARVESATDFVSDLLWFILPGDRYSDYRRGRRW